MTDLLNLFLGCLLAGATVALSFALAKIWRRGKRKPGTVAGLEWVHPGLWRAQLLCARCLKAHEPVCETPTDREFKARLLEALETNARLRAGPIPYGSSWPSVGIAHPPTEGTTAPSTTPGIGGSPGPDSDAPAGPIQHNPHSGRIDASSRKQFGMCDYPD